MKRRICYACAVLVLAGAFAAGLALADEKSAPKTDPQMAVMMKKAEAF